MRSMRVINSPMRLGELAIRMAIGAALLALMALPGCMVQQEGDREYSRRDAYAIVLGYLMSNHPDALSDSEQLPERIREAAADVNLSVNASYEVSRTYIDENGDLIVMFSDLDDYWFKVIGYPNEIRAIETVRVVNE